MLIRDVKVYTIEDAEPVSNNEIDTPALYISRRRDQYTPTRGSDERKGGHNDPPKSPRPNKKPFAKKPKGD